MNDDFLRDISKLQNGGYIYNPPKETIEDLINLLDDSWDNYMCDLDYVKEKGYKVYRNENGKHKVVRPN